MISGWFVSNLRQVAGCLLVYGCGLLPGQAQDTLVVPKLSFVLELHFGQLHPFFSGFPAGYNLTSSGFFGLRINSNIVKKGPWALIVGGGTFINREKWWRKALTGEDILMGTESQVESRLSFYGVEMLLGVGKRFFCDKVTIRGSQGLVYIFGERTKHVYTFGFSGQTQEINNFPYHVPPLNTMTVLAVSYNLDAIVEGLEAGLSLQHLWRPMQFLMTSAEGGRSHFLIQGRYSF